LPLREEVPLEGSVFFLDDREPAPFDRQEKSAHAVLSWSFLPESRGAVFAVDKTGHEYVSEWPPEVRSNRLPLLRRTEAFNESFPALPKSELDHFVVKARPRHWAASAVSHCSPPVKPGIRSRSPSEEPWRISSLFVRTAMQGVQPTPDGFPQQLADSLRAALASRRLPFLSEDLLDKIRDDFQSLVAQHQPATLPTEQQQAILDSTAKFVALSVGDYLSFPDALENLKDRLTQAFERRELPAEQQRRLLEQREWIREFIRQLPLESGAWLRLHAEPLAEFEELLSDPLWPLLKNR